MARKSPRSSRSTEFLNVDIDVKSIADPEPLVRELGPKVLVNRLEKTGRTHWVRFMLASQPSDPEQAILAFARLVNKLQPAAKRVWKNAAHKEFDIGIESGFQPRPAEWVIKPLVIALVARLGAQIRITVYSPEDKI